MSENTKAAKAVEKVDADYSLEAVPESARKGFWNMFFVMVGFTFFSASMSVGAKLGNGLDLSGFIWACIIGGVILSAYCGVLAFIGASTGMTMDLLCRRALPVLLPAGLHPDRLVWCRCCHVLHSRCRAARCQ